MHDYPVTPTARKETMREPVSTRIVERNDVGRPWVRDTASVQLYEFKTHHPFITTAQKDAILAHWEANRTLVFGYAWPFDGLTYQVIYAKRPKEQAITPTRWHVWVEFLSVP